MENASQAPEWSESPSADEIKKIVEAGSWAPSGDNCQPWRFRWDGLNLWIGYLSERAESILNTQHSASWIALGAVITNMKIAAQEQGFKLEFDLFPKTTDDTVAKIGFQAIQKLGHPLFSSIKTRCTNRKPYATRKLPTMVRSELLGVANTVPGVSLDIIENRKSISLVAKSIARFDRQFFRNRHINEGLHKWIRWTSAENKQKNDGLPIASLELDGPTRFFLKQSKSWFVARLFSLLGFDRISAMKTQSVYQQTGAFGLVTINDITPESFVMGGMVFQRIWLEATKAGLSLHPVTGFLFLELKSRFEPQNISKQQLAEIETSRKEIKEIMPSFVERTPIVFFRIGEAPAPSARSARIPVEITNAYCS